ncbi:MAG: protein kinase [Eubacterium sp.]|nr:protein kinase [Eubacterium sp.]
MEEKNITEPYFGDWFIEEKIGSGAFGTVYKIKREDFGKIYYSALKVINFPQNESDIKQVKSELGDDQSVRDYYSNFAKDFSKEIELMSELKGNSNIVSFEDHKIVQNEDGINWTIMIRMKLLTPFVDYQSKNELSIDDIVKIGIDICSALEICENRNIIHRDIKPDNIFVTKEGNFKLGDFGIARELEKTMGGLFKKGTYIYGT